jgi:hypothetical protein
MLDGRLTTRDPLVNFDRHACVLFLPFGDLPARFWRVRAINRPPRAM